MESSTQYLPTAAAGQSPIAAMDVHSYSQAGRGRWSQSPTPNPPPVTHVMTRSQSSTLHPPPVMHVITQSQSPIAAMDVHSYSQARGAYGAVPPKIHPVRSHSTQYLPQYRAILPKSAAGQSPIAAMDVHSYSQVREGASPNHPLITSSSPPNHPLNHPLNTP